MDVVFEAVDSEVQLVGHEIAWLSKDIADMQYQ